MFSVAQRRRADPGRRRALFVRALFLDPQPRRGPGPLHLPRALRAIRGAASTTGCCRPTRRIATSSSSMCARAALQPVERPPAPHLMTTASHFSLLVVDDEPDLRTLYELTLLREGYDLDTAGTVEEALLHLKDRTYSAVITDMRLPDGSRPRRAALARGERPAREGDRHHRLRLVRERGRGAEGRRLRLPDQAGRPEAVPRRRRLGARPRRRRRRRSIRPACRREQQRASRRGRARRAGAAPAPHAGQRGARPDGRPLDGDAAGALAGREGRAQHGAGAGAGRVGHRQGAGRARHPRGQRARRAAVRRRSTAARFPRSCSRPSSSATARARSPAPTTTATASSRRPTAARCSSTRSATCRWRCSRSCCARSRSARCGRSARSPRSRSTCASLSATHKDLGAEVQAGRFRQDLFYRLNVIQIRVPPLRERLEDLLAHRRARARAAGARAGVWPAPRLTRDALVAPRALSVPGQRARAREPAAPRGRALAAARSSTSTTSACRSRCSPTAPRRSSTDRQREAERAPSRARPAPAAPVEEPLPNDLARYLDDVERDILVRALEHQRYNRTAAGISLGLSLRQMRYRMARLSVNVGGDWPDRARVSARVSAARRGAAGWLAAAHARVRFAELRAAAGRHARSTWWSSTRSACRPASTAATRSSGCSPTGSIRPRIPYFETDPRPARSRRTS